MKKNEKKKGFTLIELIAVIAILGILAAIIIPNVVGYTNRSKISSAKTDAKTMLNALQTYITDNELSDTDANALTFQQIITAGKASQYLNGTPNSNLAALTRDKLTLVSQGKSASDASKELGADEAKTYTK